MSLFDKKEESPQKIPLAEVLAMRKQGLTDNQIVQTLQMNGYDSNLILEGLERADMSKTVTPKAPEQQQIINPMKAEPTSTIPPPTMNAQPNQVPIQGMPPPISSNEPEKESSDDIEELIEAIIEEKWAEVEKDVDKILEWKENADEKMQTMKVQIQGLQKNFDDLHKAIIGKIGDYDKNILNVGSQLKAMEQVFSKVLPTFTDNVSELNRITEKFRKSK